MQSLIIFCEKKRVLMKIEAVSFTVDNDPSVENKDFPNQTKTLSDERVHFY